jgi:hypothetical protein
MIKRLTAFGLYVSYLMYYSVNPCKIEPEGEGKMKKRVFGCQKKAYVSAIPSPKMGEDQSTANQKKFKMLTKPVLTTSYFTWLAQKQELVP